MQAKYHLMLPHVTNLVCKSLRLVFSQITVSGGPRDTFWHAPWRIDRVYIEHVKYGVVGFIPFKSLTSLSLGRPFISK